MAEQQKQEEQIRKIDDGNALVDELNTIKSELQSKKEEQLKSLNEIKKNQKLISKTTENCDSSPDENIPDSDHEDAAESLFSNMNSLANTLYELANVENNEKPTVEKRCKSEVEFTDIK